MKYKLSVVIDAITTSMETTLVSKELPFGLHKFAFAYLARMPGLSVGLTCEVARKESHPAMSLVFDLGLVRLMVGIADKRFWSDKKNRLISDEEAEQENAEAHRAFVEQMHQQAEQLKGTIEAVIKNNPGITQEEFQTEVQLRMSPPTVDIKDKNLDRLLKGAPDHE